MSDNRFQQALGDVSKAFRTPQAILDADGLSRQQKIELLKQWETDLRLLMVASEENMTGNMPGRTAELLRQVLQCLEQLGTRPAEGQKAPTKAGG